MAIAFFDLYAVHFKKTISEFLNFASIAVIAVLNLLMSHHLTSLMAGYIDRE